jgi:acyl-[acyl carrier protein]--UDP-N-acetylglucosamine O-acyltransferase
MERAGISKSDIESVHKAVRILSKGKLTLEQSIERIKNECPETASLKEFISFITSEERTRGLAW